MSNKNDHDIYIIPPNFIESGTFFGGMFRARNVIEAGILAFAIGVPVFMFVPFGLPDRPSCGSGRIDRHFWREFVGISDYLFEIPAESPHRWRRRSSVE